MSIKVLTPEVSAKIAAGEVVERPASVVKELIENSLDAGATQINVETRGGGVSLIRVIDDGAGIPADEVELAFQRHATSKIHSLDDLELINSLGFRGEALPSIAAVADVDILTRTAEETPGTHINLRNGAVVEKGSRGCPQGTRITSRNLFHRIPARLKFLKSTSTENGHISDVVGQYALAFPEVRFNLLIDGRLVVYTPGTGKLRDALIGIRGLEIARGMMEIGDGEQVEGIASLYPQVSGLISPPSVTRTTRGYLSFFVNRRWISSPMLAYAVEEAYHGLLMTGRHPIAVINILLPAHDIDVNVHPTKTEVKFRHEHEVFSAVQKAVRRTLTRQMPVPEVKPAPTPYASHLKSEEVQWTLREGDQNLSTSPILESTQIPPLRVIGQMANTYIIAEGPEGLYLIDQHAAHERIRFEKILSQRQQQQVEVQGLLEPITIELDGRQEQLLTSMGEMLAGFGFNIEPFGHRTYLVRAVPAIIWGNNIAQAITKILDSLEESGTIVKWEEKVAISLACHGAVRAGQILTQEEMRELVRQLEQTTLPRTCPHGRPTLIHLSSRHLAREFGRV